MKLFPHFISHISSFFHKHSQAVIWAELAALVFLFSGLFPAFHQKALNVLSGRPLASSSDASKAPAKSSIKWVDFNVTAEALNQAFRYDVDTVQSPIHLNWVDLLALLGSRYGGDFSSYRPKDMEAMAEAVLKGETTMDTLKEKSKNFDYYREAYGAVLDGMVGVFKAEIPVSEAPPEYVSENQNQDSGTIWVTKYGLKAFSPIAKGFPYNDYDDFGVARSYGFKRQHLGHDMMGQVGTPIIAVESGYVEAIGWNPYGGWRIGIRSLDQKRYYYYAHLRKNYPYQSNLSQGSYVQAGDVIGYLGRTGYSTTENTNNIDTPHLHFGLELIFDEARRQEGKEVWIDCYGLIQFLERSRCETVKVEGTKEWIRVYGMKEADPQRGGNPPEEGSSPKEGSSPAPSMTGDG